VINLPEFIFKDIDDEYVRENFTRLNDFFLNDALLRAGWKFFTLTFTGAVTNNKVRHGLGFKPLDVIQTSITGAGALTFNYALFDDINIDVTTTGACVVRCFIGAYKEESSRNGR